MVVAFTFLYEAARRPRGIGHGKKQGSSSALDAACTAKAESEDEKTHPGLGRVGVVALPWVTALIFIRGGVKMTTSVLVLPKLGYDFNAFYTQPR